MQNRILYNNREFKREGSGDNAFVSRDVDGVVADEVEVSSGRQNGCY